MKVIELEFLNKLLKIIIILFRIYHKRNCDWNADDIDSILETLKNNDVHITFFMVGDWVDKYPEAVKKIYEAGHEIGSHSNTHPHVNNLSS